MADLRDFIIAETPCRVQLPFQFTEEDEVGVVWRDGGFDVTYYTDGATTIMRCVDGKVTVLGDRIVGIQHGSHIEARS